MRAIGRCHTARSAAVPPTPRPAAPPPPPPRPAAASRAPPARRAPSAAPASLTPLRLLMVGAAGAAAAALDADVDPAEAAYPLTLLATEQVKQITLIRHGEGFHNVAGHADHDQYKNEDWFDAHLTEDGWRQAEALNAHLKRQGMKFDVVIVSPLMRALETAAGAFAADPSVDTLASAAAVAADPSVDPSADPFAGAHARASDASTGVPRPPLMAARNEVAGRRVARGTVASDGAPPFVVHELCREIMGIHPCDRRRDTEAAMRLFPGADWSLVADATDMQWQADVREPRAAVARRAREFLLYVMQRPEQRIAVVTHSTFLSYMLAGFGAGCSTHVQDGLHKWFENCEARSYVLADTVNARPRGAEHFPGGGASGGANGSAH